MAEAAKNTDDDGGGPLVGTIIYTIGYDMKHQTEPGQRCQKPDPDTGHQNNSAGAESPFRTPEQTLTDMASIPLNYYGAEDPDDLRRIFRSVAGQVLVNATRLVNDNNPNLLD
jgi:hypothetical protein